MLIVTGVGVPGEVGSNVSSCPEVSIAVHWVLEGQAIPLIVPPPLSIVIGAGVPGEAGLNVTTAPAASPAVHCVPDGHAIEVRLWPSFSAMGADHDSAEQPCTARHKQPVATSTTALRN